jgi:SulP family sulfate permease
VLVDLTRVTGIDASAMATLTRVDRLAKATGTEVVLCGARAAVLARLERAGVAGASGSLTVAQSLDAALERTEDLLLTSNPSRETEAGIDGLPPELRAHLDPIALPAGTPLFHQGDPPGDLFVLDEGRLAVEVTTPDGRQVHLRTVRAGVVVGEVAFYTGMPRTATVVALDDAVVLRLPRSTIEAWERE